MLITTAGPVSPVAVSLRPAAEAYDYEHFRNRLAEPLLLADAVAVQVFRAPLLAVPAGGARRGGYMPFDLLALATETRDLLTGRPGFDNLRVRWSPYRDTCHTVEWGEPAPNWWMGDWACGRFYGYSEEAIAAFLGHPPPQTPSSASTYPVFPHGQVAAEKGRASENRIREDNEHHVQAHSAVSHGRSSRPSDRAVLRVLP